MTRGCHLMLWALLWVLLCTLVWPVQAQPDDTIERARIAQERSAADQRLREQEQACATRFAVTSCVEAARKTHRETIAPLRQQEFLLDDQRRQQRAAGRRLELERKAAQPKSNPVPATPDDAASQAEQPKKHTPTAVDAKAANKQVLAEQQRARKQATAQAEAAKRAQAQREKVELAQQRKAAVEKRNADKAASGKPPAAALPVPGASSAP